MTKTPKPQRAVDASGIEVLDHMRRLEARATPGLMAYVIPIFINDSVARLVLLREAVARQDLEGAHRLAHTLHGSAATVGADSMVLACAEIIRHVGAGAFARCEPIIQRLDTDLESIRRVSQATGI